MRVQRIFNNYQKQRISSQNSATAVVRPSFQKLSIDEKSLAKVFPKFWADKATVQELKESLAQFEDTYSDDIELRALEFTDLQQPDAIGSWVYCKVKSFCTGDNTSDMSRFATETRPKELDGNAFQDKISVNHITAFINRLQYQLENYV